MKRFILLSTLTCLLTSLYAQRAELHFPHFAGQSYSFTIYRGMWSDTISVGKLDSEGRTTLVLPDRLKNYQGMTQWTLSGGGGLSMIFAGGENFSVSCTESQPSEENIVFSHSPENNYVFDRYRRQQYILAKVDAMRMAITVYNDDSKMLPVLTAELEKQEHAYNRLQKETATEKLYAARFAQIVDVTRGLPPLLGKDMEESETLLIEFMVKKMDTEALYTSGHWLGVIRQLAKWYTIPGKRKNFIADMKVLLKRTRSDEVYAALTDRIIATCETYNWYNEQLELAEYFAADNRTDTSTGRAAQLMTLLKLRNGQAAPELIQGILPTEKTILVFHESGCNSCSPQMQDLAKAYPELRSQGYEVVSVSADEDSTIFNNSTRNFPWPHKYCDFQSFAGRDFINYGVMGIPTFYLIEKGVIKGRYAKLEEIMEIVAATKCPPGFNPNGH